MVSSLYDLIYIKMCISTYQLSDRPGRKLMKVVAQVRILYDQPPPHHLATGQIQENEKDIILDKTDLYKIESAKGAF